MEFIANQPGAYRLGRVTITLEQPSGQARKDHIGNHPQVMGNLARGGRGWCVGARARVLDTARQARRPRWSRCCGEQDAVSRGRGVQVP